VWGAIPIGAVLGGWLGDAIGLWPTLAVMALGQFLAPLWVLLSPVRELRTQPLPASAQGIAVP
jgi:predicted MFS family arabinose efflux permease